MNRTMKVSATVLLTIGLLALLLPSTTDDVQAAGSASVIGHAKFPAGSLSKGDVEAIFLGKKAKIGGTKVVLATLKGGDTHKTFLKAYVGKTTSQYRNYWKKLVFTGKAKAPKSFKSEKALAAFVAKTPGAIGYIAAGDAPAGTKAITVK